MTYPAPKPVNINDILIDDISKARQTILQHGVAVYILKDISKKERNNAVNKTAFYANINDMFKESVKEPTLTQKLNPKGVLKQRVPMAAQGFINEYFTPIHSLINGNSNVGELFDTIYQKKTKRAINRLRLCQKSKVDEKSLHIEGEAIFTNKSDLNVFNPNPENWLHCCDCGHSKFCILGFAKSFTHDV